MTFLAEVQIFLWNLLLNLSGEVVGRVRAWQAPRSLVGGGAGGGGGGLGQCPPQLSRPGGRTAVFSAIAHFTRRTGTELG